MSETVMSLERADGSVRVNSLPSGRGFVILLYRLEWMKPACGVRKIEIVRQIVNGGLVAVIRAASPHQAIQIADACVAGGVTALEIAFTTPAAADAISCLTEKYRDREFIIGAGTVIDPETARIAILAGAQFIVSPAISFSTARLCNRYQIPYLPGASTIKEIIKALEVGASIVKIFPGEILGPAFVKAVHGPLPHAPLMPTGGVTLENAKDWMDAGCVALGVGGSLTQTANTGDFESITRLAQEFIRTIHNARHV